MFTKIAQFRKVLYKWTPQEAKLLHGFKNLFQALRNILNNHQCFAVFFIAMLFFKYFLNLGIAQFEYRVQCLWVLSTQFFSHSHFYYSHNIPTFYNDFVKNRSSESQQQQLLQSRKVISGLV
jgi:hypothetical protein